METILISEEGYLHTSYDGLDREFRDGEVIERGLPNRRHSRSQARACGIFLELGKRSPLHVYPELCIRLRPRRWVVPDIAVFAPEDTEEELPTTPPFLVVEFTSPDDREVDLLAKLEEYRQFGVRHIWQVDAQNRRAYFYDGTLREVSVYEIPEYNLHISVSDLY